MRVGIIGGGVSGLVAAYLLNQEHEVELLEANPCVGGHTNTETLDFECGPYGINTGFIVFNQENYPNFVKLMQRLDVPFEKTSMSFSVSCKRTGLEYGFATWDAIFAQRRNVVSLSFWRMLLEIRCFQRQFDRLLEDPASRTTTLGEYLRKKGYSRCFIDQFIIPFGAAIWSAAPDAFGEFPLYTFVAFFKNHGFLSDASLLQWYTLTGGSDQYLKPIMAPYRDRVFTNTRVVGVTRSTAGVAVAVEDGSVRQYDEVVLAVHSDQALEMLTQPTDAEREILGAMPYQPSDVVLHTDTSVLPEHRQTWSSWNYCVPKEPSARCTVTYSMNILQNLKADTEFLVTLNQNSMIDTGKMIQSYKYAHPVYTRDGVAAQRRYTEISGVDRVHYAGAYWGYGFHEDGVNSALAACRPFGATL